MSLVLTATRQHLCKRKKANLELSKHFSNKYCLPSWTFNQHILLGLPSSCREQECPGGVGAHSSAAPGGLVAQVPCAQHPNSLHPPQLCKTQAPLPWSSSLAKEIPFLSPAPSVLGDYSWPQTLFGLLLVFCYLLSLFWTRQTAFNWRVKEGSLTASWARLSYSYLEVIKKKKLLFSTKQLLSAKPIIQAGSKHKGMTAQC